MYVNSKYDKVFALVQVHIWILINDATVDIYFHLVKEAETIFNMKLGKGT